MMDMTITVCNGCEASYGDRQDRERGFFWCTTSAVARWTATAKCAFCGTTQAGEYPLLHGEPFRPVVSY